MDMGIFLDLCSYVIFQYLFLDAIKHKRNSELKNFKTWKSARQSPVNTVLAIL